jgi:mannosyltransferase
VVLAAIAIAGAALRFATLSTQSFWLDEAIAIEAARLDLVGMIETIARTEGNPPLYHALLGGWIRVFGDSEAAVRSLSALFGTATIPVAFAIGRRLATPRVGLVAAALVAFSPLLVWFSQEARPYALLVLLSALSFWLFAEALENPRRGVLAGWAVVSALAIATHYFAALLILPEALWLLHRVRPRRRAVLAVGGLSLVPLALVPLLVEQGQVQNYSFVKGESLATRVIEQVPKQMLVGFDAPAETAVTLAAAALTVVAVWLALTRAAGRERRALAIAAGVGLASMGIALALAVFGGDYYISRYLLAAWLPLALVAAVGLGARRSGWLGLGVAAALCALFAFVVVAVATRPELQRDDWRGIARSLGPARDSRAIVASPAHAYVPLKLYVPDLYLFPSAARVSEIDVVAVSQHVAGEARRPPPVPSATPPSGFTEIARHSSRTFTVVRYRSARPVRVTPAALRGLALVPGSSDAAVQLP